MHDTIKCPHWDECVKIQTEQYFNSGPKLVCKKPGEVCQTTKVKDKK